MNRRGFLKSLGLGAFAAATFDPEMLLWVPGQKTIFLPTPKIFHSNTFITPTWITQEAALHFSNNLTLIKHFNSEFVLQ